MQKNIPKLNSSGISHLLIPLMIVVIGVASIGTYLMVRSSASSRDPAWPGIVVIGGHENAKRVEGRNGKSVVVTDLKVTLGARGNDMRHITKVYISGKKADRVDCEPWGRDQQCDYAVRQRGNTTRFAHHTTVYVEKSSKYRKHGKIISDSRQF